MKEIIGAIALIVAFAVPLTNMYIALSQPGPLFVVDYDESCETLCAKMTFSNKRFAMTREEYRKWQIEQANL